MSTKLRFGRVAPSVAGCLAAAALVLSGCGHTTAVPPGGTVRVALNEYRLTPASIQLHGGALTIVATNVGRLTHNLVISRGNATVATIHPLSPGETGQVTVTLTPGRYLVGSNLLSDEALGLYGHIRVSG